MSDIIDPRVVRFSNESIRPLCELLRAAKVQADYVLERWNSEIKPLVANDDSVIKDGRENEGVSVLIGSDINSLMSFLEASKPGFDSAKLIINKPCVRTLEAR